MGANNNKNLAIGLGQAGINAGSNLLGMGINYAMWQQQNEATRENMEYGAELNDRYGRIAADEADQRTRKLYNDLHSPKAIREQLEEAGLSVGLMYGNGGGSGGSSNGAQAGQGLGGGAAAAPQMQFQLGLDLLQMKKLKEEIKGIQEENRGKKIDNDTKETYGNDTAKATLDGILADNKNKEVQRIGGEMDNQIKEFEKQLASINVDMAAMDKEMKGIDRDNYQTNMQIQIDTARENLSILKEKTKELIRNNEIGDRTKEDLIKEHNQRVALLIEQVAKAKFQNQIDTATKDHLIKQIKAGADREEIEKTLKEWEKNDKGVVRNRANAFNGNPAYETIRGFTTFVGGLIDDIIPIKSIIGKI